MIKILSAIKLKALFNISNKVEYINSNFTNVNKLPNC